MFFQGCSFYFNGKSSQDYDLYLINTETGLNNRPFGLQREIIENNNTLSQIPYYIGTKTSPLEGKIQLFSKKTFTLKRLKEIAEWLYQDDYCEFISTDNPDIFYNLIFVDESEIYLGCNNSGYIELNFRCDAPWAWTRSLLHKYNFKNNNSFKEIEIENKSQLKDYNPLEIEVEFLNIINVNISTYVNEPYFIILTDNNVNPVKQPIKFILSEDNLCNKHYQVCLNNSYGNYILRYENNEYVYADELQANNEYYINIDTQSTAYIIENYSDKVSIYNKRNCNQKDAFTISSNEDLDEIIQPGEKIYANMNTQEILSSKENAVHRTDCISGNWIQLEKGINILRVEGRCYLTLRCKYPAII